MSDRTLLVAHLGSMQWTCVAVVVALTGVATPQFFPPPPPPPPAGGAAACNTTACTCAGVDLSSVKGVHQSKAGKAGGMSVMLSLCGAIPKAQLPSGCTSLVTGPSTVAAVYFDPSSPKNCTEIGTLPPCGQNSPCGMTGAKTSTGLNVTMKYTFGCTQELVLSLTDGTDAAPSFVANAACITTAAWAGLKAGPSPTPTPTPKPTPTPTPVPPTPTPVARYDCVGSACTPNATGRFHFGTCNLKCNSRPTPPPPAPGLAAGLRTLSIYGSVQSSQIKLTPTFAPGTFIYTGLVEANETEVLVQAVANVTGATVTVNGAKVPVTGTTISLSNGSNSIQLVLAVTPPAHRPRMWAPWAVALGGSGSGGVNVTYDCDTPPDGFCTPVLGSKGMFKTLDECENSPMCVKAQMYSCTQNACTKDPQGKFNTSDCCNAPPPAPPTPRPTPSGGFTCSGVQCVANVSGTYGCVSI